MPLPRNPQGNGTVGGPALDRFVCFSRAIQNIAGLELIDCSREQKDFPLHLVLQELEEQESEPAEIEKAVWSDINRAFAEPMTRSDDSADYVATQILAELFKREGFGGIAYKSNFGEDG